MPGESPLEPRIYEVASRRQETTDVTTLTLEPVSISTASCRPGQFNMLTAFGVGEVPVSICSRPDGSGALQHTVREVGPVTAAICRSGVGTKLGVRGPFGTDWAVDSLPPLADVVVVAGGIGLAPLRGAVELLVDRTRDGGGRVFVLVGARRSDQIIFGADLDRWRRAGAHVAMTVDVGSPSWGGPVGVVTSLIAEAGFAADRAVALVCGPEIMMRFTARTLIDRGVTADRIRVSLERNMECGVAWCGHCQLGPYLLCRDGPVLQYSEVASLLEERER